MKRKAEMETHGKTRDSKDKGQKEESPQETDELTQREAETETSQAEIQKQEQGDAVRYQPQGMKVDGRWRYRERRTEKSENAERQRGRETHRVNQL